MNLKNILFLLGGLVTGGAIGVLSTKKYFQEKYQKRYEEDRDSLEEYYQKVDEYAREDRDIEEEFEDDGINSPEEGESRPGGRMSDKERAEIKKKLKQNWEGTTNYAGMYKTESKNEEEITTTNESDEEICKNCKYFESMVEYCEMNGDPCSPNGHCDEFVHEGDATPEEEVFEEHQKNKDRPPKIISADAYSNLPAHIEQVVLYFYTYDEVLCEDNEEIVEEPELLIGDALTKYDFIDSDERIIFVMNYAQDTCYEIQKVDASWTDSH